MTPTIEQAAAMAWDLVRADNDPPFSSCTIDHREKLIYHAQNVQKSGLASDVFEQKVKDVLANPGAAIAELKARAAVPTITDEAFNFVKGILQRSGAIEITPEPDAPPTNPLTEPAKPKRGRK